MNPRPPRSRLEAGENLATDTMAAKTLLRGRRLHAAAIIVVSFAEGAAEAAILTLFARLALGAVETGANEVYVPGLRDRPLGLAVTVLVGIVVVRAALGLWNVALYNRLQVQMIRDLRHEVLGSYALSSWAAQEEIDEGSLQQLIVTLPSGVAGTFSSLIQSIGQITIMAAMLSYSMATDWSLTIILLAVITVATYLFYPLRRMVKKQSKRALSEHRLLSAKTAETFNLRFESQAFGLVDKISSPLHRQIDTEASVAERVGRLKGSVVPLFNFVTYLAVSFGLLVLAGSSSDDLARTGPILLVVLRSLSYGVAVQQAAVGLANLQPSLDLVAGRLNYFKTRQQSWGSDPLTKFEMLEFKNVSFSYDPDGPPALRDASFEVGRGMRVGVVGPSGGGKSTAAKLALGICTPDAGEILVNGHPIQSLDRDSWSRRIGVVPQDAQLLAGTISFNLRFFRDGLTDQDLWNALELADLAREIRAFPQGLETVLGAGERTLSGGQRQRLAIARAFVTRPEFVVMDEPTSSIDVHSEAEVSNAIASLPRGTTLLIVSHRLKILESCDKLIRIVDGRATEVKELDETLSGEDRADPSAGR